MPKPDSTQLNSTQPEKQANTMHTDTARATNPDHKQLPDTPPLGLQGSAWQNLRYRPLLWVSAVIILLSIAVAAFPSLFTPMDPSAANLCGSLAPVHNGHPMGFTQQGYDVYARVTYGTRASVIVGVGVTLAITAVDTILGAIAGCLGGWVDAMLSRATDMFFAVPLILAGIVLMQLFTGRIVWSMVFVLAVFGWPQVARVVRPSMISVKNEEYVAASKALGLSDTDILLRHALPNHLASVIVMAATLLDICIVTETMLSYLGVGLPTATVSQGNDISIVQQVFHQTPSNLFRPALALTITVLGFIFMGDASEDSLDPKEHHR